MKKIEAKDVKMYNAIVAYLKAGGQEVDFIRKFCDKYEIDKDKFVVEMRNKPDEWTDKLRRVGLID